MFQEIRVAFLVKKSEYRPDQVLNAVTGLLYGRGYVAGNVKDTDCGEISLQEAIDAWEVDPADYEEHEDE